MLGTAGFNRDIAIVARIKPSADAAMIMMRRLRFFAATPLRGRSIEERLGANPAGRTIVSSFVFRCDITADQSGAIAPQNSLRADAVLSNGAAARTIMTANRNASPAKSRRASF